MNRVQIGWYTIEKTTEYVTHYECAAWAQTVSVEAGRYPVYAYPSGFGANRTLGHTLYVDAEGEIVHATFTPLFGGVPCGPDRGSEKVGKRDTASIRISVCDMHRSVSEGALELFDTIESHEVEGERSDWNGEGFSRVPHTYTFYRFAR